MTRSIEKQQNINAFSLFLPVNSLPNHRANDSKVPRKYYEIAGGCKSASKTNY
jgi:hypothetical protein